MPLSPVLYRSQHDTTMKDYGNGIYASNDWLADIAKQCIEREMMQRQCKQASHGSEFPSWGPAMGQWGRWNISDRD